MSRLMVALWTLAAFGPLAAATNGNTADDASMVREALAPYVRPGWSHEKRQERIEAFRDSAAQLANSAPNEDRAATVVFARGMTTAEVADLIDADRLEVLSIHIKTPYNDRGVVQSIDIGTEDLLRYRGRFEDRAEKAIGAIRYKFLEWSEALPEDEAEAHRRVATSPMRIYRCELFGKGSAIARLPDAPPVSVVIPDNVSRSSAKIHSFRELQGLATEAWNQYERQNRGSN